MELVYEDEILPEIEIREYSKDSPSFVVFSDTEIEYYLHQFFPNKIKQIPLREMIQHVTQKIPGNVTFVVDASKKKFSGEDNDIDEYLQSLKDAMNAPNYTLQFFAVNQIQTPIEAGVPRYLNQPTLTEQCSIKLDNNDTSRLLSDDNLTLPVKAAILNGKYLLKWQPGDNSNIHEWIKTSRLPDINSDITELPTLQELQDKYFITLDDMTPEDFNALQDHLTTLDYTIEEASKSKTSKKSRGTSHVMTFIAVCKALAAKLSSYKVESVQDSLSAVMVPVNDNIQLPDLEQLYNDLTTGSITLDDARQSIRQWYTSVSAKRAQTFMNDTTLLSVPSPDAFRESKKYTETWGPFVSLHHDITDFQKGEDTTMYDGNPGVTQTDVYEELQNEEYIVDNDDTEEKEGDVYHAPSATFDGLGMSEGAQEVLEEILPLFTRLVNASGLPCDVITLLKNVATNINRTSRKEQLLAAHPDLQDTTRFFTDNTNSTMIQLIQQEWAAAKDEALYTVISQWWVDIQRRALEGTLEFNVATNGSAEHAHLWASRGFPFHPKSASGVINYISAVLEAVGGPPSEDSLSHCMSILPASILEELHGIEYERAETDKAEQARVSLIETIKAYKDKKAVNILPSFVTAFLYLPSLLPQKGLNRRQISWMQGCCLVPLDATYDADIDWKKALAALYSMKTSLAKDRMLKPRGRLVVYGPKEDTASKPESHSTSVNYIIDDLTEDDIVGEAEWFPKTLNLRDKSSTLSAARTLISTTYSKTHANVIIQAVIESQVSLQHTKTLLIKLLQGAEEQSEIVTSMKQYIASYDKCYNSARYSHIFSYTLAAALCHGNKNNDKRKRNYYSCVSKWSKTNAVMTNTEITAFINTMREKQKDISLKKLDMMEDADRVIQTELKQLGLIKLVTREELVDNDMNDDDYEEEGIMEFMPPNRDAD